MSKQGQEFERYLLLRGRRLTIQRRVVVEAILELCGHVTANELAEHLRHKRLHVSRGSLYRALELLCDAGLTQANDFGRGVQYFEVIDGHQSHDHMFCTRCGRIIEFQSAVLDSLRRRVARLNRFAMTSHRLYVLGHCDSCSRDE